MDAEEITDKVLEFFRAERLDLNNSAFVEQSIELAESFHDVLDLMAWKGDWKIENSNRFINLQIYRLDTPVMTFTMRSPAKLNYSFSVAVTENGYASSKFIHEVKSGIFKMINKTLSKYD